VPRHVVLISRDASLAIALRTLLGQADQVSVLATATDWAGLSDPNVGTVVVDAPIDHRRVEVEQLRRRYDGRVVVLLGQRDDEDELPLDPGMQVMRRPFAMLELWEVISGPAPAVRRPARRWGRLSPPRPATPPVPPPQRPADRAAPRQPPRVPDGGQAGAPRPGVVGVVLDVTGNEITVKSRRGPTERVIVGPKTVIRKHGQRIQLADLKPQDALVAVGKPNQQQRTLQASIVVVDPPRPFRAGR
jgi:hypothetical protein